MGCGKGSEREAEERRGDGKGEERLVEGRGKGRFSFLDANRPPLKQHRKDLIGLTKPTSPCFLGLLVLFYFLS